MSLTPAQLGFVRAIGIVILTAILTFLGNSANLNGIVSIPIATLIAAIASAIEQNMAVKSGNLTAGFGAITQK